MAGTDAVRILLAAGANPTLRDKEAGTVLDAAGELGGCLSCQEQLFAALRVRDVDPSTFHKAVRHNY